MDKKEIIKIVIQTLLTFLTALATSLGVASCQGTTVTML